MQGELQRATSDDSPRTSLSKVIKMRFQNWKNKNYRCFTHIIHTSRVHDACPQAKTSALRDSRIIYLVYVCLLKSSPLSRLLLLYSPHPTLCVRTYYTREFLCVWRRYYLPLRFQYISYRYMLHLFQITNNHTYFFFRERDGLWKQNKQNAGAQLRESESSTSTASRVWNNKAA